MAHSGDVRPRLGDAFGFLPIPGMPYPKNLQTAMEVEAVVRENGAVPATIAILNGVPHVGLSGEQLKSLAVSGRQFQKTARRDIAHVVASGGNGATTVSATMFFAHKVGIPIFVTGGIGGVHRNGEQTMDISSDLTELGKTPVTVISAGVKSILDIPRTLEYLVLPITPTLQKNGSLIC
jgi:pseudouridine-5'-phosphate glycosidase